MPAKAGIQGDRKGHLLMALDPSLRWDDVYLLSFLQR
jgi:hypothetical protein